MLCFKIVWPGLLDEILDPLRATTVIILLMGRSSVGVKQLRARDPGKAGLESSARSVCLLPLSTGKSYKVTEIILKLWKILIFWQFGFRLFNLLLWTWQFFLSKPMYYCFPLTLYQINALLIWVSIKYYLYLTRLHIYKVIFLSYCFDWQLNDNSEALAHQRLATKMLAAKMKEMEKCGNTGNSQSV